MRELLIRILRKSIPVVLMLGVIGYIFAEATLMLIRTNGGIDDPANHAVKWRAPLSMAGFGVAILVVIELLQFALRRKHQPLRQSGDSETQPIIRSGNPEGKHDLDVRVEVEIKGRVPANTEPPGLDDPKNTTQKPGDPS